MPLGVDPGDGISGFGSTVEGLATGPIGMMTNISLSGPGISVDIDITTMNAPSGWMRFISGLKDAKEATLTMLFEKSQFADVLAALGVSDTWTITFPDGSTFVCAGYIKDSPIPQVPQNDKIAHNVTIRLSGIPTFTPGS